MLSTPDSDGERFFQRFIDCPKFREIQNKYLYAWRYFVKTSTRSIVMAFTGRGNPTNVFTFVFAMLSNQKTSLSKKNYFEFTINGFYKN